MCGYFGDTIPEVREDDYRAQLEGVLERYEGQVIVKIFTSGSFLDDREVPPEIQDEIVARFVGNGARKLIIESRPEYVTEENLGRLTGILNGRNMEIAMGLESASDPVLVNNINKGFRFVDFEQAARTALEQNCSVKAYTLLKPPFLSEAAAIADSVETALKAAKTGATTISVNPVNIQNFTVVEHLFREGRYRPPYLWSLVEVLKRLAALRDEGAIPGETVLMSSPSGAGTRRGVHNCGKCDKRLLEAIGTFSLTQDASMLEVSGQVCACRERWEDVLVLERFVPFNL
jgi:radical SAM enzyme (TIGR01210 family)